MMAAVRLENEAWTDPRYVRLAKLVKLKDPDYARIKCMRVWSLATELHGASKVGHVLDAVEIDDATGIDGFATAMVSAKLAEATDRGVRICGAEGRIEWLKNRREAAKTGGLARKNQLAEIAREDEAKRKPSASQDEAKGKPSYSGSGSGSGSGSYSGSTSRIPESASEAAPTSKPKGKAKRDPIQDGQHQLVVDGWHELYKARTGQGYGWSGKAHAHVESLLKLAKRDGAEVLKRARVLFEAPPGFLARDGTLPEVGDLVTHWNRLVDAKTRAGPLFNRGHAPPSDASEFGDGDMNKRGTA